MSDTKAEVQETYAFGDHFVAFLSSLFVGGMAWATLAGLVLLARWGLPELGLEFPTSYYLELVYLNLPWVFGLVAGTINHFKVLQLEA